MVITIIEEHFEVEHAGRSHMFAVPKKEITFVEDKYVERTYELLGGVSVPKSIKIISKEEYYKRMDKYIDGRN